MEFLNSIRNRIADKLKQVEEFIRVKPEWDFKCEQYKHISRSGLRTALMDKLGLAREKVHLADQAYACGDLSSWEAWITQNQPQNRKYDYNSYDCDDFTRMLVAWTNLHHIPFISGKQAAGFAIGMALVERTDSPHMLVFVDNDLEVWFIDTQDFESHAPDEITATKIYL